MIFFHYLYGNNDLKSAAQQIDDAIRPRQHGQKRQEASRMARPFAFEIQIILKKVQTQLEQSAEQEEIQLEVH